MKAEWHYPVVFLLVEVAQATVRLLTLGKYEPSWTVHLSRWYHRRQYGSKTIRL